MANVSAPAFLLVAPLPVVLRPAEPQAAIATAQPHAATAIERPRRSLLAALLLLALRNVVGFPIRLGGRYVAGVLTLAV